MTTLTLERLDELAADASEALGEVDLDGTCGVGCLIPAVELAVLIEYARERAARERCQALLPNAHWCLRLGIQDGLVWAEALGAYTPDGRPERVTSEFGGPLRIAGQGSPLARTPTEAYLALATALEAR